MISFGGMIPARRSSILSAVPGDPAEGSVAEGPGAEDCPPPRAWPGGRLLRKAAAWLAAGLAGQESELCLRGMQRGFVMDTPLRLFVSHLLVLAVLLVDSLVFDDFLSSPGSRPWGGCAAPSCAVAWVTLFAAAVQAAALGVPVLAILALPPAGQARLARALPALDTAVMLSLWALRLAASAALPLADLEALRGPAPGLSGVLASSLAYALFFPTSLSPLAPPLGAAVALVGAAVYVALPVTRAVRTRPPDDPWELLGVAALPALWGGMVAFYWAACSPLGDEAARQACRREGGAAAHARCRCRRCRAWRGGDPPPAGAPGAPGAPAPRVAFGTELRPRRPGPCWRGRLRELAADEVAMLGVFSTLLWLLAPASLALAAWGLVRVSFEQRPPGGPGAVAALRRLRAAPAPAPAGACPAPLEGADFFSVAIPASSIAALFAAVAVAVRVARVTAQQRDALIRDIVPEDVADALVLRYVRRQAAGRPAGARGPRRCPPAGGAGDDPAAPASEADVGGWVPVWDGRGAGGQGAPPAAAAAGAPGAGPAPAGPPGDAPGDAPAAAGASPADAPCRVVTPVGASPAELAFFRQHRDVSLMFSDLVGFTALSSALPPRTVLALLHAVFSALDRVSSYLGAYKYETVGDAYITASNLGREDAGHRLTALRMGVTLARVVAGTVLEAGGAGGAVRLRARVGLHTGDVAAGVLGARRSVMTLVGDAMNTASRMESQSLPGHVQASGAFWAGLPAGVRGLFYPREVAVKGKGPMRTYVLDVEGQREACAAHGLDLTASPAVWGRVARGSGR